MRGPKSRAGFQPACVSGANTLIRTATVKPMSTGVRFLVGMTAFPEARLAREAELAYAMIGLPTDYDCWRPRPEGADEASLLEEIIGNLQAATDASIRLIKAAIGDVTTLRATQSPAHDALRLAIWSDKSKIDPREVERLGVLWGKYF